MSLRLLMHLVHEPISLAALVLMGPMLSFMLRTVLWVSGSGFAPSVMVGIR